MARIAGVDLPKNKRMDIALTYIYGIGRTTALHILETTGVDWTKNADALTPEEANTIRKEIEANHKVEGDLRRDVTANIKRLMPGGGSLPPWPPFWRPAVRFDGLPGTRHLPEKSLRAGPALRSACGASPTCRATRF